MRKKRSSQPIDLWVEVNAVHQNHLIHRLAIERKRSEEKKVIEEVDVLALRLDESIIIGGTKEERHVQENELDGSTNVFTGWRKTHY